MALLAMAACLCEFRDVLFCFVCLFAWQHELTALQVLVHLGDLLSFLFVSVRMSTSRFYLLCLVLFVF